MIYYAEIEFGNFLCRNCLNGFSIFYFISMFYKIIKINLMLLKIFLNEHEKTSFQFLTYIIVPRITLDSQDYVIIKYNRKFLKIFSHKKYACEKFVKQKENSL
ncbi:hypothetical protein BpHYR1_012652 [Brachionus plicatilis]|uniref:Uncharacterized protein n=1 Tax=Brachionus plicatilis TaxID=10195 RepID=A0A3M7SV58_BRAPC|nr:hypothetical protein BpHYR1_012652 [Brachionus plicatilis]